MAQRYPTASARKTKVDMRDPVLLLRRQQSIKEHHLPLQDRKVTAFYRPSGCGKSTLLRAINRIYELYPQQRAEAPSRLMREYSRDQGPQLLRARIGMVFQKPTPFPMSIHDNVAFGIKLYERCRAPSWKAASRTR